jgi:serine/threonine protein kinase
MEKIGKFQVVETIGKGGFGVIYLGLDPHIKRRVAIKTCTSGEQEIRNRFFHEARIAGNLHHRNVVTVYDFGVQDEVPYLVQEYLTGEDLDRKIKRQDFIPLPEKLHYLIQIARGLDYAHSQGVIHRDVKPANLRILEDGTVKIMDFGIAKLASQETGLTRTGMTLGTASYLSPEQIRGEAVDPRTDIFSFGTMAYELLSYRRPFQGEHISTVLYQILNESPPPLRELCAECDDELAAIIGRCLERDPDRRFQSCGELLEGFTRYLGRRRAAYDSVAGPLASGRADAQRPQTGGPRATGEAAEPERRSDASGAASSGVEDFELTASTLSPLRHAAAGSRKSHRPGGSARGWWVASLVVAAAAGLVAWLFLAQPATRESPDVAPADLAAETVGLDDSEATREEPSETSPLAAEATSPAHVVDEPPDVALATEQGAAVEEEPPPPPPPPPTVVVVPRAWSPALTVRVDGQQYRLDRELRLELAAGRHLLQFAIVEEGYRDFESLAVTLAEGEERRVVVPIPPPGHLQIQPRIGTPEGEVFVGSEFLGKVPPILDRRLRAGSYTLQVRREGSESDPLSIEVEVAPGRRTVATFDLTAGRWTVPPPRPLDGQP